MPILHNEGPLHTYSTDNTDKPSPYIDKPAKQTLIQERLPYWSSTLRTKLIDGTKPNTNPKTNLNPNTNPIQLFYAFFEHRPMILKLAPV